jgi:hypothetical protein
VALYFDCGALGTYSRAAAQAAASAWAPTGGTDTEPFCSGSCYARTAGSGCAVWCYTGNFTGRVSEPISLSCLCPNALSPTWN